MKPILILGAGRSGKTTLARQLKNKLPGYDLLHADSVRFAIMQKLPSKFPNELLHYEANDYYSSLLLGIIEDHIKQSAEGQSLILDGGYITPSFLNKNNPDAIVIYLGYGNSTPEQIFQNIRDHDTPSDWSKSLTDAELESKIKHFQTIDQLFQKECKKYGYSYIDTSKNRSKILESLCNDLYTAITG